MDYKRLFDSAPSPLLVLDTETWRPLEFNTRAAEYLGYTREEFATLTISNFEFDPDPAQTREHIRAIRRAGHDAFPARHRTKDGAERRVHVDLRVIRWLGRDAMLTVWHAIDTPANAPEFDGAVDSGLIVARSEGMRGVLERAQRAAITALPVLLLGESGVGKEVVARHIHACSHRRHQTFMPINCGALPKELADGELFGTERGAFTGADQKRLGRIEIADGGTVFLDEIADLDPVLQVRLLRVLQDGEIHRLGAPHPTRVDIRVVAATNRDLRAMVEEGAFREDLYYRINGVTIEIPPLRQRVEDIHALVEREFAAARAREDRAIADFSAADLERLERRAWRGNVRELINVVRRAIALAESDQPRLDPLDHSDPASPHEDPHEDDVPIRLDEAIREHLYRALAHCGWVIEGTSGAAARLGMQASTLRSQMKRYGVVRPTAGGLGGSPA